MTQRSYKLMPTYWSFRPKDFLEMRFEEGEDDLTEEIIAQQVLRPLAARPRSTYLRKSLCIIPVLSREMN